MLTRSNLAFHSAVSLAATVVSACAGLASLALLGSSSTGEAAKWAVVSTLCSATAGFIAAPQYVNALARRLSHDGSPPWRIAAGTAATATLLLMGTSRDTAALALATLALAGARSSSSAASASFRANHHFARAALLQGPVMGSALLVAVAAFAGADRAIILAAIAVVGTAISMALLRSPFSALHFRAMGELTWWRANLHTAVATAGYATVVANTETWFALPRLAADSADKLALFLRAIAISDILTGALSVSAPLLLASALRGDRPLANMEGMRRIGLWAGAILLAAATTMSAFALLITSAAAGAAAATLLSRSIVVGSGPAAIAFCVLGRERLAARYVAIGFAPKVGAVWLLTPIINPYVLVTLSSIHSAAFALWLSRRLKQVSGIQVSAFPIEIPCRWSRLRDS